MSASFEEDIKNYSFVSSLNENKETITIESVHKITGKRYLNTIGLDDLVKFVHLEDAYNMMLKCLRSEDNHTVSIHINLDKMQLVFDATIGGYFHVNFETVLIEQVSVETQLTIKIEKLEKEFDELEEKYHQLEKKHLRDIELLEKEFDKLEETAENTENTIKTLNAKLNKLESLVNIVSHAEICIRQRMSSLSSSSSSENGIYSDAYWPINATEIAFKGREVGFYYNHYWDYNKINLFYQLERILFDNIQLINFEGDEQYGFCTSNHDRNIRNDTVTEIIMHNMTKFSFDSSKNSSSKANASLDRFPNVTRILFNNCDQLGDIVKGLSSYCHKIKYLTIENCAGINVEELIGYCRTNNIVLNII